MEVGFGSPIVVQQTFPQIYFLTLGFYSDLCLPYIQYYVLVLQRQHHSEVKNNILFLTRIIHSAWLFRIRLLIRSFP